MKIGINCNGQSGSEKVINIATSELGYLEKRSNSNLDSKTANAGSGNYTKYWRDIKPDYQGQPWCACFVTWCFVQAFGKDKATALLKHYPYVYCPTMANLFTLNANPKIGDIVIFKRNGTFVHTGIVISVNGDYFQTIEGNTSGGSAIIANGGGVCKKGYYNSKLPGTKFCRPNYDLINEDLTMAQYEELKNEISQLTETVKILATELHDLKHPMLYNYIDKNMPEWARSAVSWAVENGILNGDENGLNLDDKDLRFITMMYRMRK